MEIWRNIPGYDNIYQVSNYGRVRSCDRIIREYTLNGEMINETIRQGHILKQSYNKQGYTVVGLYTFGKVKTIQVHILVAKAFLGIPVDRMEVHHIDRNRTNNNLSNLIWLTKEEHLQVHNSIQTGYKYSI